MVIHSENNFRRSSVTVLIIAHHTSWLCSVIAMFLVTWPVVINVPTRGLLAVETKHAIAQWLANLNIKRNMMSMFVNKKHRYSCVAGIEHEAFVSLRNKTKFVIVILSARSKIYHEFILWTKIPLLFTFLYLGKRQTYMYIHFLSRQTSCICQ